MNMRRLALALLAILIPCGQALACTLQTPMVALGAYNPLEAIPAPVVVSVQVTCPAPTTVAVSVSKGNGGTYDKRVLTRGTQRVYYNLYLGTNQSTLWGDGTQNTGVIQKAVEANTPTPFTGNAQLYPSQSPEPGVYTDTLVFTATF